MILYRYFESLHNQPSIRFEFKYISSILTRFKLIKYRFYFYSFLLMSSKNIYESQIVVTICGGGHAAHLTAACFGASEKFSVRILTRNPQLWDKAKSITMSFQDSPKFVIGTIDLITDSAKVACLNSKIIILAVPADAYNEVLSKIAPWIQRGAFIGCISGYGGFSWIAKHILKEKIIELDLNLWALSVFPFACRILQYGITVLQKGKKNLSHICCFPVTSLGYIKDIFEDRYELKLKTVDNFLLGNLLPWGGLHPVITYSVWRNWDNVTPVIREEVPLFYEDINDLAIEILQGIDQEVLAIKQAILSKYRNIELSDIRSNHELELLFYSNNIEDQTSIRSCIKTNSSYKGIEFPLKLLENGYCILDTGSRFFTEDINYNLSIIQEIGVFSGVKTPIIDHIIDWARTLTGEPSPENDLALKQTLMRTGCPSQYGVDNLDQLIQISTGLQP